MRQIREVLRQKWGLGLSNRQVADRCGVSRPTVTEYMRPTDAAGLSWSLSEELDDTELERKLFPPPAIVAEQRAVPDWPVVHQELSGKGGGASAKVGTINSGSTIIDQTLFLDWPKSSVAYSSIHWAKFIRLNRS